LTARGFEFGAVDAELGFRRRAHPGRFTVHRVLLTPSPTDIAGHYPGIFHYPAVLYNGARQGWVHVRRKRIELCSTDDVAPGAALKVEIDDLALAVFNVGGEFYVTDDACTHGPGSLSEGYIEDDVVECNFHNGQFNIRTGEVVLPPCMVPIKTYPVEVLDGKVTIEV
jgi:nitrite reductase/ring-hydroxylating ferredoxin subunit